MSIEALTEQKTCDEVRCIHNATTQIHVTSAIGGLCGNGATWRRVHDYDAIHELGETYDLCLHTSAKEHRYLGRCQKILNGAYIICCHLQLTAAHREHGKVVHFRITERPLGQTLGRQ